MLIGIALVCAVVSVLLVTLLRLLLASRIDMAPAVAVDAAPVPEAWAALYAERADRLQALGWQGPLWFESEHGPPGGVPVRLAQFRAPDGETLALVGSPTMLDRPHLPRCALLSRWGAQGPYLVTSLDPTQALMSTPQVRYVQCLATDLDDMLAEHAHACEEWRAARGPRTPWPESADALQQAGQVTDQVISASFVAQGLAIRRAHRLFPSWRMAWRVLRSLFSRRLPPPQTTPLSPARLAHLAALQDAAQHAAPPADRQWTLFGGSVVLFMLTGGLVFGWRFAWQLLVVILIHELGHYLAMRACGYRSLQMLALPLVGGVAMGREVHPDPVHRAWIALMGPLPGILIGLVLWFAGEPWGLPEWLNGAAWVFLLVNLVNLAPFPPLDGSHVVRALAGRHALAAAAWVTLVGGTLGLGLAGWLGYTVFAVLIGLQLLAVPGLFRQAELARRLAQERALPATDLPPDTQLTSVLETLEHRLGPVSSVEPRLGQARALVEQLRMRPAALRIRVGLVLLYGAALLVPLGWLIWPMTQLSGVFEQRVLQEHAQLQGLHAEYLRDQATLQAAAATLSVSAVLETLDPQPQPAASASSLVQTEQRLGRALTADLRAFYADRNGGTVLDVRPVEALAWDSDVSAWAHLASDTDERLEDGLAASVEDVPAAWLFTRSDTGLTVQLTPAQLGQMLPLDAAGMLRYDLGITPLHAGLRVYQADAEAHADLPAMWRARWVYTQHSQRAQERRQHRWQQHLQSLADVPMDQLLERLELAVHVPLPAGVPADVQRALQTRWPGATETAVLQTSQRLGVPVSAELAALVRQQDGGWATQILPMARWRRAGIEAQAFVGVPECGSVPGCKGEALTVDTLAACIVIGGNPRDTDARASLLWCPQRVGLPFLGHHRQVYATLADYLRQRLARFAARY